MKIIFASQNAGKHRELSAFFAPLHLDLVLPAANDTFEVEETGATFIENALIKARHACHISGLPSLSDDSGLVVKALSGAPGIYSARYAGKKASAAENIKKLLDNLKNIPDENRQAYFYCVIVLMQHENDPTPMICEGRWDGFILHEEKGHLGFGYDPIFYVPSQKKTAAELPIDLKNKISHRGIALTLLKRKLLERS
ncbi:MAG: non-canonical purine NTP pyrophosphatase, RdgB/HAM1 family [Gammaproteobacteria bacterium RIFCSPHIGHO2_12_FULL_38_14]|nr:MAG: non-canonical purine NTP pyrophosphatase, RdgB/HAM1 family [Gammaproteobacteria bacterium RIFCSPHIGHO2_12_FULL_38_14]